MSSGIVLQFIYGFFFPTPQLFATMGKERKASITVSVVCFFLTACVGGTGIKHYTNKWLVHVPLGEVVARAVARHNNMEYEGPVMYLYVYICNSVAPWT